MSVFLAASRSSLRAARMPTSAMQIARRNVHIENTSETSLPFPQGRKHTTGLAVGVTTFFGLGFGLPLAVVYYQLNKQ
ncbi:uncharacterized protein MJAP1_002692 [Malassezia japonica]|uniref:Cytochrome c oxidase subunit 8, mitochondrial n=1 Tax=Malassezia japonica TaxID=223818 RepID=A0AAF0F7H0_9BASI|nr:uncharacterized protein MJAP1_002692 [Malassezia japonica]WFD39712.1 hypothetical protein MJAP1_002692 [Malassezia japonica]